MTPRGVSDKMSDMPKKLKPENVEAGKRLERLRKAHGYETIRDVANALDIHEDAWRAWERGHNAIPHDIAGRLKDRWGATRDYLYDGDETAMPAVLLKKLRLAA